MNIKSVVRYQESFDSIAKRVYEICGTEESELFGSESDIPKKISSYSAYGFTSLGRTIGFPSDFVNEVSLKNPNLAEEIISDRAENYFKKGGSPFTARKFLGQICGCVSNKYNYFDDNQVIDIVGGSPLVDLCYSHVYVTPERLHLRAVDIENPFKLANDESDLYFCYFIDNSMVGASSFKVQFGIYRQVCTNGLIIPVREFVVVKQIHRGNKSIAERFNQSIYAMGEKREEIVAMLKDLSATKASIIALDEEHRIDFLARKLLLSKKEADKIITLFKETYGGETKWDMVNAITQFARDVGTIDRRLYIEKKAILAA